MEDGRPGVFWEPLDLEAELTEAGERNDEVRAGIQSFSAWYHGPLAPS